MLLTIQHIPGGYSLDPAYSKIREEVTVLEMAEALAALAVCRAMSLVDKEGFHKLVVVSD
jgi:hypothetical protein